MSRKDIAKKFENEGFDIWFGELMTADKITARLVDAFSLLDFSERLLGEIETAPLSELPRIISLLKKNVRDAKKLINDAEAEFDNIVKEIDRHKVEDLVMYDEWAKRNKELLEKEEGEGE